MKLNKFNTETITYRRTTIELYQDNDGFWGWIVGNTTMLPNFSTRSSALNTAKHHIDDSK